MQNNIKVKIDDCSCITVLNILQSNKIGIVNFERLSANNVQFDTSKSNYKSIISLIPSNYQVSIVKDNSWSYLFKMLTKKVGVVIGVIVVLICHLIFGKFTFYIKVYGVSTLSPQQVIQCIKKYGVAKGKINNFDNAELEKYILKSLDQVSLVSVVNNGNTITINIKEKLPQIDTSFADIVAPRNMLVNCIEVIKGTPAVTNGSIVHQGDVLVHAYYLDSSGNKVECEPMAKIVGHTWFCSTITFEPDSVELVRTGKKIVNKTFYIGGRCVGKTNKQIKYKLFEHQSSKVDVFNGLFLPLSVEYKCTYELAERKVHREYSHYKDKLENEVKSNARKQVPNGYTIIDESVSTNIVSGKYVITAYLHSMVEVNNVN